MSATRFVVRGRVQGVAFRAHARAEALALGVRGRACNRADGSVEVWVDGDAASVEAFARWLAHGPPLARVDSLERAPASVELPAGFAIG